MYNNALLQTSDERKSEKKRVGVSRLVTTKIGTLKKEARKHMLKEVNPRAGTIGEIHECNFSLTIVHESDRIKIRTFKWFVVDFKIRNDR